MGTCNSCLWRQCGRRRSSRTTFCLWLICIQPCRQIGTLFPWIEYLLHLHWFNFQKSGSQKSEGISSCYKKKQRAYCQPSKILAYLRKCPNMLHMLIHVCKPLVLVPCQYKCFALRVGLCAGLCVSCPSEAQGFLFVSVLSLFHFSYSCCSHFWRKQWAGV